ncbi:hypothetical protein D3C81_727100 [compost metagenome]
MVHRIEANQRGKQPPVGLGQVFPGQVALGAEQPFQMIQFGKHLIKSLLIGRLRSGKACPVHAIVDRRIDPLVKRLNLPAQRFGIQVQAIAGQLVESRVEDANDLR